MKAYLFDGIPGDARLPHDSGKPVAVSYLEALGIYAYHYDNIDSVNELAVARGYKNRDEVTISPEIMGAVYEEKAKLFFDEHLHEDEEIRYIRDGRGYFDVRGRNDEWVRIQVDKDDLLILPAGIYHRFTTDSNNYLVAMRLFKDEPKWTPLSRTGESNSNPNREEYIARYLSSA